MAKVHTKGKGKSGSTRPKRKEVPEWVDFSKEEVEKIIVKLAKEGYQSAEIGRRLRDEYGIPSARLVIGEKISEILKKKELYGEYPEDLFNLLKQAVTIKKHLETNKKDMHNKRALFNTEMKIWRLIKYYKSTGVLPEDWKYNAERAAIIVSGR